MPQNHAVVLQWGRRSSATETSGRKFVRLRNCGGFNGAAALQRRRQVFHIRQGQPDRCFNGAAALQRRRHEPNDGRPIRKAELQWGRRSSATETRQGTNARADVYWLQWGRRSSATETREKQRNIAAREQLQWGRRSSATETLLVSLQLLRLVPASMGPPLFSDGDVGKRSGRLQAASASMGPPLFSDGDLGPANVG